MTEAFLKDIQTPSSTYRLQFNSKFTFKQAAALVDYFHKLGITHLYASPLFMARSGSMHGYDVVDYQQLNPEIGTLEEFLNFIDELHKCHMSLILDLVPNHMSTGNENLWWMDLLENGMDSPFAEYFDIDWHPSKTVFEKKIFLPILEQQFGSVLEDRQLILSYDKGQFFLRYKDHCFPTCTDSWKSILTPLYIESQKLFPADSDCIRELDEIIEFLCNSGKLDRRIAANNQIKNDLRNYFNKYSNVLGLLYKQLEVLNGIKGNPDSFNDLEKFLDAQHYRLCFWKVANDEINYRRFFDIFEYASLKIENPKVFKDVHKKVFEFINNQWIDGLRIDHIDGLWDPQKYLEDLHEFSPAKINYLVVEKILTGNEQLLPEWPVQGSVGYDFLNQLNGLFVFQNNKQKIFETYQNFIGNSEKSNDLKYICKKLILKTTLSSELNLLNRKLNYIAENQRSSKDFTFEGLKKALSEIIACFPVYRSYIRSNAHEIHEEDRKYIHAAVERAKRVNRFIDPSIYDFIHDLLLLTQSQKEEKLKKACEDFVMHFQQVTGPVMAKGFEDTALYRFFPLSSLNEVGGEPNTFGISLENFHKKNLERFASWPQAMLSSTTHDTKRSEDVRARINVLSELSDEWQQMLNTWEQLNRDCKTQIDDEWAPDRNEEYLIYQTLLGTWPFSGITEAYIIRIQKYMEKAINEAKLHSTWIDANEPYHQAVKQFIEKILKVSPKNEFMNSCNAFFKLIADFGMLNSLSQTIIKLTSPGIPNIYQGNELWDFTLVDPDNRSAVDFEKRATLINQFYQPLVKNSHFESARQNGNFQLEAGINNSPEAIDEYKKFPEDGRIKFFVTQRALRLRQAFAELFSEGSYIPIEVEGPQAAQVIAYARYLPSKDNPEKGQAILILTGRFFSTFMKDFNCYKAENGFWNDTFIKLPSKLTNRKYTDIFSNKTISFENEKICLQEIFSVFPFTILNPSCDL